MIARAIHSHGSGADAPFVKVDCSGPTPEDIELQLKFQHMNVVEAAKRTQLSLGEIRYLREHLELNRRDEAQ
jgi:DNA-binding NtrC family response regulator